MTLNDLIKRLEAYRHSISVNGDTDVMIFDRDGNVVEIAGVDLHLTEKGEYPKDWNMPAVFIELQAG